MDDNVSNIIVRYITRTRNSCNKKQKANYFMPAKWAGCGNRWVTWESSGRKVTLGSGSNFKKIKYLK